MQVKIVFQDGTLDVSEQLSRLRAGFEARGHCGDLSIETTSVELENLAIISVLLDYIIRPDRVASVDCPIEAWFEQWFVALESKGIRIGPVYALLCDGQSMRRIDQRFKRRNGWARRMVRAALALCPPTDNVATLVWKKSKAIRPALRIVRPCSDYAGSAAAGYLDRKTHMMTHRIKQEC